MPWFEAELEKRFDYHYTFILREFPHNINAIPEDYFLIAFMASEALAHYKNERVLDFLQFVIGMDMMFTSQMQNRALLGIVDIVARDEAAEIAFKLMNWKESDKFWTLTRIIPVEDYGIIVRQLEPIIADYAEWPIDKLIDDKTFFFLSSVSRFLNQYRIDHPEQFPDGLRDNTLLLSDRWFNSDQERMKTIANDMLIVVLNDADDERIVRGIDPQHKANISRSLLAFLPVLPRERLVPLAPILMQYIDHPTHARYAVDSLTKIRTGYRGGNAFTPDELKQQVAIYKAWYEDEFVNMTK
jgi:hypothetical protein